MGLYIKLGMITKFVSISHFTTGKSNFFFTKNGITTIYYRRFIKLYNCFLCFLWMGGGRARSDIDMYRWVVIVR